MLVVEDDCVKPAGFRGLVARICAVTRRTMATSDPGGLGFILGDVP